MVAKLGFITIVDILTESPCTPVTSSVLVNVVSPDSPISPKDGKGTDSHYADEERGSQRIGNSRERQNCEGNPTRLTSKNHAVHGAPVFHAQYSSNSCRLI